MNMMCTFACTAALGLASVGSLSAEALAPGYSAPAPSHLDSVLEQLDRASASFKSAEADVHKDLYEALVKQHTLQQGSIYFERKAGATQMGAKIVGEGAVTVEYRNGTLRRYQPGLKCFEVYSTGNKSSIESFLTLGFGGSGKDLSKSWVISDQGTEKLNDGKQTIDVEKLDLVARDQGVRNNFTHVTLWVDAARGISLKQVFYTPSGDTQTATYTNVRLNQSVNKKPFEISGNACSK